jgi:amino acid transporter
MNLKSSPQTRKNRVGCLQMFVFKRKEPFMDTSIREVTSEAIIQEKKKLRKEFRLFDMIFFTASAILGLDTLGAVSSQGGQALSWVLISALTFLLPYSMLSAELGSTFSQEGGVYEWCKLACGRFYAALTTMIYWVSNPLWIGGTLAVTAIIAIKTLGFGNPGMLFGGSVVVDTIITLLIALAFIWFTTGCAIISLKAGKWLPFIGICLRLGLFTLFILLAIAFAFSGHASGAHIAAGDLLPSSNWLVIMSSIIPLMVFSWSGPELQNGAGEEMRNPRRDVPRSISRAVIVTTVAHIAIVAAILFTLSKSQLSQASGFISAYQIVTSVLPGPLAVALGWLVAIAVVVALASHGGTWIIGADRTYAISALDRTAPVLLGRFSGKYGTPIAVNIMSGIVASIAMAAAVLITAVNGGATPALFSIVLGFAVSTTAMSYALIFPAYLILRYKYPNVPRPYKVPGGMVGAWIVTLLPFLYAAISTIFILVPFDVSSSGVSRLTYEVAQFACLGAIVLLAVVFYIWGHLEKRNKDVVVELNFAQEEPAELELSASATD